MAEKEISLKLSFKNLTKGEIDEVRRGIAGIGEDIGGTQKNGDALKFAFAGWANEAVKFAKNGLLAIADAAKQVAEGLAQIALDGSKSADIEDAFMRMARAVGVDGVAAVEALEEATAHLIDNTELMRESQKLMSAGMTPTIEQLRTMGEAARVLSKSTGTDMSDAFKAVSDAMLTGRTRALSMMGVLVDVKDANDDLAEAAKEAGVQIDSAAQVESKRKAVLESLNKLVKDAGVQHLSLAERVEQGRVAWGNFLDDLGMAIARSPVLASGLEAISHAIQDAFGEKRGDLIKTLAGLIDDFAIALVKGARMAVQFGKVVGEAFLLVKFMVQTSLATSIDGMVKFIDTMHAVALTAQMLPGVAKVVGFAAQAVTQPMLNERNRLKGVGDSMMAGAVSSVKALGSLREGAEFADTALGKMIDAMEAARGKGVDLETMAARTGAALNNGVAAGAQRSAKFLDELRTKVEHFSEMARNRSDVGALLGLGSVAMIRPAAPRVEPIDFGGSAESQWAQRFGWLDFQRNKVTAADPMSILKLGRNIPFSALGSGPGVSQRLFGLSGGQLGSAVSSTILSALTGGGNVGGSVGGLLGGSIAGKAVSGTAGKALGGMIGSVVPGLGTILGSFVGGGVSKLFGSLFGPSKTQQAGRSADVEIDALRDKLVGPNGLFQSFTQLEAAAQKSGTTFIDVWTRRGVDGLRLLTERMKTFEKGQKDIAENAELELDTRKQLQAAIEKYGFTIDELGPKWRNQQLIEQAQGLMEEFTLLTGSGIDQETVIKRMGDAFNEYALTVKKAGGEIPESMRPILQQMVDNKQLVDENGDAIEDLEKAGFKFSMTMSQGFQGVIDKLDELIGKITSDLGKAITNVPKVSVGVEEPDIRRPHVYAESEDGGPPVFDTPVRRITKSGWGWLNPGDVAGGGVAGILGLGGGVTIAPVFQINALDVDSVRRAMRTTIAPELFELLRTSGVARQQLTAATGV